ncbi:MAG: haloalkane dehalogenase 1 [Actinomycetota bacterium]
MTTDSNTPSFLRTPEANFDNLKDFPYAPHYFSLGEMRMHYIDEGPQDGPVALMIHGMPTWSYLYRDIISQMVAAGYRCIAPDHLGFGRSDKPTDPSWYNIARHIENLAQLISHLDLRDITLFVQDWGGPTGLAQYEAMPERFSRLVIMNTWLHHDGYEYSPGILNWIAQNSSGGMFRDNIPEKFNWGTLMAMATDRVTAQDSLLKVMLGEQPQLSPDARAVQNAYDAPFLGLGEDGVTGPRRFPMCIPANDPIAGNAVVQERCFAFVNATQLPVHFVWGINDNVFTPEWGRIWHGLIPHSTWHEVNAGHFLQDTCGTEIANTVLHHVSSEKR